MMFATASIGQTLVPVEELLSKGAKKLSKDELSSLLTGATISGRQRALPDVKFEQTLKPDGSISGGAMNAATQRGFVSLSGKWWVNDNGQSCSELRNSFGHTPTGTGACQYWYVLGGTYYQAPSDDPKEQAILREVKR